MRIFGFALALGCIVLRAQNISEFRPLSSYGPGPHPQAIQQQSVEYVLPELIVGGEWTSSIKVVNLGASAMPITPFYFWDNTGQPLVVAFRVTVLLPDGTVSLGPMVIDSGGTVTLSSGAMLEATFVGDPNNTRFGHVTFNFCATNAACSSAGIYAEVALRNHNAIRPDFESVFPLEQPATSQYMLWDNRNGFSGVLYVVNNQTSAATAIIDFYSTTGRLLKSASLPFVGLGSQILTIASIAPETAGQQGFMVIHGAISTNLFTATAIRINPTNSFTPLRAFVPSH
jgi:hypothetical protein